jgi:50S ribosomal subunit-associated GTPase HflX
LSGAECDTDRLVVAKCGESLAISKQAAHYFEVEIFKIRKLNELEVRKQHRIKISNRYADLENLSDSEDIKRAWEKFKQNIKISAKDSLGLYELKQHKPWFDEECLSFLDQRKQVKKEWLQDLNQSNVDNLKNIRR